MPHIDKLLLRDIGPFRDATIEFPQGSDPKLADVYLLTGPNGSGKSTALYAIADCLGKVHRIFYHGDDVDVFKTRARRTSKNALCALASGDEHVVCCRTERHHSHSLPTSDPFQQEQQKVKRIMLEKISSAMVISQEMVKDPSINLECFGIRDGFFDKYSAAIHSFSFPNKQFDVKVRFSWAAFAYAGQRAFLMGDASISTIREPTDNPFINALSFFSTVDSTKLLNWIANQDVKRLRAKEKGDSEKEKAFHSNIVTIEQAIADITGTKFRFDISGYDLNVRVQWNGVTSNIGVLPDGLKSILSWVADLLMRLDRIPWENDTPVLQRHFLLLLDEIDIHLHPTWQRKVLPIVQRLFPNAQIIATTHSPFVVASAEDAYVISLKLDESGQATVDKCEPARLGVSYSAVLRSIFGIESEFDIDTEKLFQEFHAEKRKLLSGETKNPQTVFALADKLAARSEEVAGLVGIELRQIERQLARTAQQ